MDLGFLGCRLRQPVVLLSKTFFQHFSKYIPARMKKEMLTNKRTLLWIMCRMSKFLLSSTLFH